jgi:hypothetical protein
MRRTLLYVLLLVFLASLCGCQKKMRFAKIPSMPVAQTQSTYDRFAPIIIDLCDPVRQARWIKKGNEPKEMFSLCALCIQNMAQNFEKIKSEELRKFITEYIDIEENRR